MNKHLPGIDPSTIKLEKSSDMETTTKEAESLSTVLPPSAILKRFVCEVCEKCFKISGHLTRHMVVHTGVKQFRCEVCEKRFTQNSDLKIHMVIHTGRKQYKCDTCCKWFTQTRHLKCHQVRAHGGGTAVRRRVQNKRVECEVCLKLHFTQGDLDRHMVVHTGQKPVQCELCSKRFTRRSSLNRHTLVHTGERPFKCYACAKSFTRPVHLRKHELVHSE